MRIQMSINMSSTTSRLKRISNKEVIGPAFSVFVPTIHQIRYSEGDHITTIEIEGGESADGAIEWSVYSKTLTGWQPPYQEDDLPAGKRSEILRNVSRSLDLLEMPHQIV